MKIMIDKELFVFVGHWNKQDRQIAANAVYHEASKYFTAKIKKTLCIENEDIIQIAILSIIEEYQKKQSNFLSNNAVYAVRRKLYAILTTNRHPYRKNQLDSTHIDFNEYTTNFNSSADLQIEYENTIESLKSRLSKIDLEVFELLYEKNLSNKEVQKKLGIRNKRISTIKEKIKNELEQLS
jgi:RNA polymerase sigma factor (sigma-70 family)